MLPLVSVVVPVFNVEDYVSDCLNSIHIQTYSNIEILIVDDCSTDNSLAIVEMHMRQDGRIRLVRHKQNLGLSEARNTALAVARGDYVMFVDSDDMVDPELVSTCVEEMCTSGVDVLTFGYKIFRAKEDILFTGDSSMSSSRTFVSNDPEYFKLPYFAWLKCVRMDWLRANEIGFLPGYFYEDHLFHWQLGLSGARIVALDRSLYFYRQRPASITFSPGLKALDKVRMYQMIGRQAVRQGVASNVWEILLKKSSACFWSVYFEMDERNLDVAMKLMRDAADDGLNGLYGYKACSLRERIFLKMLLSSSTIVNDGLSAAYWTRRMIVKLRSMIGSTRAMALA